MSTLRVEIPADASPHAKSTAISDCDEPMNPINYAEPTVSVQDFIVFSRLREKPAKNFTQAFEYSFFGAYTIESEEYKISRIRAAYPPIYIRKLVQFFYERDPGPNLFCIGEPVTVTIESIQQHQILGHALYGLVRIIDEQQEMSKWPKISTRMVVEVHCIPSIEVDWHNALPWITCPPNVIFIQPHGFLEDSYVPLPVEDIDWIEVNYGDGNDYDSNVASVYLGDYDYEEAQKHYIAKTVKKPRLSRLLPDDAYLHWDDTVDMVNYRIDEDDAEDLANDAEDLADDTASIAIGAQSVADDTQSLADTLVESDHGLLRSTTTSPPPSDEEDLDAFREIKLGLVFQHSIGHAQAYY